MTVTPFGEGAFEKEEEGTLETGNRKIKGRIALLP